MFSGYRSFVFNDDLFVFFNNNCIFSFYLDVLKEKQQDEGSKEPITSSTFDDETLKTEGVSTTNDKKIQHVELVDDIESSKTLQCEPVENLTTNELGTSRMNETKETLQAVETKPTGELQCPISEIEGSGNEEDNVEHLQTDIPILVQDSTQDISLTDDPQLLPIISDSVLSPGSDIENEPPAISLENTRQITASIDNSLVHEVADIVYNPYPLSPYFDSSAPPISLESEALMVDNPPVAPSVHSESLEVIKESSVRPRSTVLTVKETVTQNIVPAERIEHIIEELIPFTEEQLNHFYFNRELQQMDFFVDEFLKVSFLILSIDLFPVPFHCCHYQTSTQSQRQKTKQTSRNDCEYSKIQEICFQKALYFFN